MFGRDNIVKVIKEGNINRLKEILKEKPDTVKEKFGWKVAWSGGILDLAGYYNQSDILKFLIVEKKLDVNTAFLNDNWTALHHAARTDSFESVKTLLELGADPGLKTDEGETAYDFCDDKNVKELLLSAEHEKRRKKLAARQEEFDRLGEEARKAAEAMVKGSWKSGSPDEITHVHETPDHQLRLTDIFNFSTKSWRAVTKDLQDGHLSQETKFFGEIKDKEMINQARAELDKANGAIPEAEAPKPEAPKAEPKEKQARPTYDQLRKASKL